MDFSKQAWHLGNLIENKKIMLKKRFGIEL